jgi:hypothetical protein
VWPNGVAITPAFATTTSKGESRYKCISGLLARRASYGSEEIG